ncbi:hypothetical protein DFP72DRAFT_911093 [Ephemerocybe angulata]|uniref:N-acetyltransferase domain-containing protein n=1 Tax=Ephemerocybe angulata TaxID=980116 RepID=A0A8H6HR78_9AGAR|nr:hypothetical protein DFP72DRAFT_911093 [Tulosesus angulatus]
MVATTDNQGEQRTRKPYVRLATSEDHPQIIEMGVRAFVADPILLYIGNVQEVQGSVLAPKDERGLRAFIVFVLKSTASRSGRVTVVVLPFDDGSERIVSATYWLPPNKRIENYQLVKLAKDGALPMVKAWGLSGITRMTEHYLDNVHHILVDSFKQRGFQKSDVDSKAWYLTMAMTDPEFQGRGFVSLLMREQFAHAPGGVHILETLTEKNKGLYEHFGFELQKTFYVGEGKVGLDGLPESGESATGVKVYPMIKWGNSV